jgi:peptidoglycan/LPS O-acetylase OafA/YrhL
MIQLAASKNLHQLTALRFFAAMAVLLSHLGFLKDQDSPLKGLAHTIFNEGYSGVAFFFVLSGFILSHSYQDRLINKTVSKKKFFLLRLARVYPLHILTALPFIGFALYEAGTSNLLKIALNISLLQSWIPRGDYYYSYNSVSWSLSNEVFFYTSFMFLALLSNKALTRVALVWVCAIVFAAGLSIYMDHSSWSHSRVHYLAYISPVTRLLDFIAGMLIYRVSINHPPSGNKPHEIISVGILISAMYLYSTFQLPDVLRSQLLYLPIMAYVVWSFSSGNGQISRAISRPIFVLLGDASFALYMIHQPIINHGFAAYNKWQPSFDLASLAIILAAVSVICSIFIYKYLELPVHNSLRKIIGGLK